PGWASSEEEAQPINRSQRERVVERVLQPLQPKLGLPFTELFPDRQWGWMGVRKRTKGADGWRPSSALGWGCASRRPQRSAVPSHGVHLSSPTERDGRQGGPAHNKKGLETLHCPPPISTSPHHWPMTPAPHQVTCTVTK
ncbi:hypothetical protein KUCAC02_015222, partial [Chaenocephalus aceratus]